MSAGGRCAVRARPRSSDNVCAWGLLRGARWKDACWQYVMVAVGQPRTLTPYPAAPNSFIAGIKSWLASGLRESFAST